jgi:hypothetical protein
MKRVVADSPRHDIFKLGWNVLVVNPSDVKRGDKERYQKTDALDSKNLSNQLKSGVLRGVLFPQKSMNNLPWLAIERK